MHISLHHSFLSVGFAAVALSLTGCGTETSFNRSVDSVHQPVVSYSTFLYDIHTDGGSQLSSAERDRLDGWLDSLNVGYGDNVAIATGSAPVGTALYNDLANVVGQRGMLIHEDESAAAGVPPYGSVRLIVRRAAASVPGCPDWRTKQETNITGAASSNFGCGVNSNLAGMVANPEDLVRGQTTDSDLRTATSSRAINTYRDKNPTGAGELKNLGGN